MAMMSTLTEADLAVQLAWTRRLARALVGQADEAEDVAQETLIAAWQHRPETGRHLGPWLMTVARNLVRSRVRGDRRRSRREVESEEPSPRVAPSPEQSLAAVEAQRRLLALVSELYEPYRQVLVLRFFEDQSAADIARSLGIPAGTVRWRLKTALDLLRARMDDAHGGDRAAWVALLLPGLPRAPVSAERPVRPGPETAAGRGMAVWGSVALVGAAAITAALVATRAGRRAERVAQRPASAWVVPSARPPVLAPAVTAADRVGPGLRVQVQDVTGGAIPGATVRTADGVPLGRTDAAGSLESNAAELGPFARVLAQADGYAEGVALSSVPGVAVVRLMPQSLVAGKVVARATGQPVAGVNVWCEGRTAVSGVDGQFALRDVPPGRHALVAYGDGWFGRGARPISLGPADTARDLLVEVERAFSVSGRVSMNGAPAPGMTVELTSSGANPAASATTDAEGRYRAIGLPSGSYRVSARAQNNFGTFRDLAVVVEAADVTMDIDLGRREGVVYEAVDDQGRPVPGLAIRSEQTHQEMMSARTCHTDAQGRCALAGLIPTKVKFAARDTEERTLALPTSGGPVRLVFGNYGSVQGQLRRRDVGPRYVMATRLDGKGFASAHSDDQGRFALEHLPEGVYRVEVYLQNGICVHTPREALSQISVRAGERANVELEVASGSAALAGVVVDESGRPVADALVSYDHHDPHLARNDAFDKGLDLAVTDARGAFRFEHVLPHYPYRLQAHTRDGAAALVEPVRAGATGVRMPLARLADLDVEVAGFAADRFTIEIVRDGEEQLFQFGSGHRGNFRFDNLRAGPVTVRARSEGRAAEASVLLHPGQQAHLRLEPATR